jgi:hypothetical protein
MIHIGDLVNGQTVKVSTRYGRHVSSGIVESVSMIYADRGYVFLSDGFPSGAVYDSDLYVFEAEDAPVDAPDDTTEPDDTDSAPDSDAAAEPSAPPAAPKSKSKLTDDDAERLLMKIGDTALNGLKSMGLKSGAIYPLMIKINTALKAALDTKD